MLADGDLAAAAIPKRGASRAEAAPWTARAAPVALALALALAFQGARGLGEPDEGRNAQIAATMLASGDWLVPRLDGLVYLDKPPLTFWLAGASLAAFGRSELAVRLPLALVLALATAAVGWLGAQLWGARAGPWCALAYAVSLGPFAASAVLTPDAPLAAAAIWTAALFRRATRDGDRRFWLLCGVAAGLGLLTKGAAMLLLAAPLFVAESVRRRGLGWLRAPGPWLALAAALAVGLPWFVWTALQLPGAAAYFVSNQVVGRLAEQGYDRNAQASKVVTLYLPTLLLGALPWSLEWPVRLREFARDVGARRLRAPSEPSRFLAFNFLVPLAVFCAARSRLPLYLLPLFAPLALWTGRALAARAGTSARRRRAALALVGAWAAGLVAVKLYAAERTDRRDGRRLAQWVAAARPTSEVPVWSVDADLHSLPFYGLEAARWATTKPVGYPMFTPLPRLGGELATLRPDRALLVTTVARLPLARDEARAAGYDCREGSAAYRLGLLHCTFGASR